MRRNTEKKSVSRENGKRKNVSRIWSGRNWPVFLLAMSLMLTGILAAGCKSSDSSVADVMYNTSTKSEAAEDYNLNDVASAVGSYGSITVTQDSLQVNSDRKLITTVTMETETEHYDDLMVWLSTRMNEVNGYVEYSETNGSTGSRRYSTMTLRIPAANLEDFLNGLSEESNVTYQSRSVDDVTLDYVDVESHKAALQVEQERLMALLEKAESLEDLLTIEERLTEVRYELESYESRLRTYDNQIHYSTVHLTIREVKVLTVPEPESFGERVASGFKENLEEVKESFVEFAVEFLSSLPTLTVWAVFLIVLGLIGNKICKNRKKKAGSGEGSGIRKWKKRKRGGQSGTDCLNAAQEKKDGE